jgi:RNA polymerase sigma-70 factor (ECF subfamily)
VTAPHPAAGFLLTLKPREFSTVPETCLNRPAAASIQLLTRQMALGGEEAFCEFHNLYFDRLYQFLLAVTRGQEQEARDALQETLLRVARSARVFDSEEVFWCWLKAVARNAARDRGRSHRRHVELLRRFALERPVEAPEPAEDALGAALDESLEELSDDERGLIEAKYVNGQTIRELSAIAGATEKAVESRLLRLRRRLRESILRKLGEP